jgi:hypothetical protein
MSDLATLTKADQARLQKLADEAGRTPRDMLKHVLRDGFEQTEKEVRLIKKRMTDTAVRPAIPHDHAMERIELVLEKHAEAA